MNIVEDDGDNEELVKGFGVGLIPVLIKRRAKGQEGRRRDDIRRGRRALKEILGIKPLDVEVSVDGKPWKSDLCRWMCSTFHSPGRRCRWRIRLTRPTTSSRWSYWKTKARGFCRMDARAPQEAAPRRRRARQGQAGMAGGREPLAMSVNALAIALRVPATRSEPSSRGARSVAADTPLRLARFYGTTPSFG